MIFFYFVQVSKANTLSFFLIEIANQILNIYGISIFFLNIWNIRLLVCYLYYKTHVRALQFMCYWTASFIVEEDCLEFPIISWSSVHGLLRPPAAEICLYKYLNMIWESIAEQNLDASIVWFGLIEIKSFSEIMQHAFHLLL